MLLVAVPMPLVTRQVCTAWLDGAMLTKYGVPLARAWGNAKVVAPASTVAVSPRFSCITLALVAPVIVPLTVNVLLAQVTLMLVTGAVAVPDPPATVQVWPAGCRKTLAA